MYSLEYAGGGDVPKAAVPGATVLAVERLSHYLDLQAAVRPWLMALVRGAVPCSFCADTCICSCVVPAPAVPLRADPG